VPTAAPDPLRGAPLSPWTAPLRSVAPLGRRCSSSTTTTTTGKIGSEGRNGPNRVQNAVAGYIRVSTASQDHAYQRSAIEAAARARGERVDEWFADVASGGTLERPEFRRLQTALDARRLRRVWVWRLDRLTRTGIADTLECVDHVRRSGAELVSVADQIALDTGPVADLVLSVLAWCAQIERTKIAENQAAARARMALEGRPWGRPPLPPDTRAAVLRVASHGFSRREIAKLLDVSKSYVDRVLRENDSKAAAENMRRP
jgi:DNA invertase Pin-like site-specific DNA recombinase